MYYWNKSVVADLFDDEYIVANLDNGLYYSIQGNIINVLSRLPFEKPESIVHQLDREWEDFQSVWQQLLSEGLLTSAYTGKQKSDSSVPHISTPRANQLSKYADMQDLLALDPIHDVDEQGWPTVSGNGKV